MRVDLLAPFDMLHWLACCLVYWCSLIASQVFVFFVWFVITNETNKQASKQTNKQTNSQSTKQTNKQTNNQPNKQTNKQPNNWSALAWPKHFVLEGVLGYLWRFVDCCASSVDLFGFVSLLLFRWNAYRIPVDAWSLKIMSSLENDAQSCPNMFSTFQKIWKYIWHGFRYKALSIAFEKQMTTSKGFYDV